MGGAPVLLDFQRDALDFRDQVPVRLQVGGADLLVSMTQEGALRPYLPLLLPGFAMFGLACLRLAGRHGRAALELDDYSHELLFQLSGEHVLVCSTMYGRTVKAGHEKLLAAWLGFAREVQEAVVQRHPEMRTYGYWRLADEEPDATLTRYLTDPAWFAERDDCFG